MHTAQADFQVLRLFTFKRCCRKRYCLTAGAADAAQHQVIDEDNPHIPPPSSNPAAVYSAGTAQRIAEYSPKEDTFVMPGGLRQPREPPHRSQWDVDAVTEVLVECTFPELAEEEKTGPPTDYGAAHLQTSLGFRGITDFPRYHFDPEADKISAALTDLDCFASAAPASALTFFCSS